MSAVVVIPASSSRTILVMTFSVFAALFLLTGCGGAGSNPFATQAADSDEHDVTILPVVCAASAVCTQ